MRKEKALKKKIKIILTIVLVICLIFAISYLIVYFYTLNKDKRLYDDLQNEIIEDTTQDTIQDEQPLVKNEIIEKIKELQQENAEIKGWIKIEDTNINYPLLQATNNDYYLTHNYKKQKSAGGSIFINKNSNIKDKNSNVIIYGHYMKNGEMFADLWKYQKKEFYEQHPIIKVTTEETEEEYEIIYVFKSRVFYQHEKNVFRYYQYYNFEKENIYNEYINNCKKIQLYDTWKTATYGEQLITLITCEYSQENGRMVVVAKKIK